MASFRDITGSRKAVIHLKRAILADRVSHAYLICGDSSSEKQDLAEAFAQTLLPTRAMTPAPEREDPFRKHRTSGLRSLLTRLTPAEPAAAAFRRRITISRIC